MFVECVVYVIFELNYCSQYVQHTIYLFIGKKQEGCLLFFSFQVEEAHFLRLVGILHDLLLTETETKEKREELLNHTVNLLTNIPKSCYDDLLVPIEEIGKINNPKYEYDKMNVEAIAVLLEFLEIRLQKVCFMVTLHNDHIY